MEKVSDWTPQIWHCDPLVVTDEGGAVIYADGADVEFRASRGGDFIGHALVTDAEAGPALEIDVLSRMERMDRVPDVRLGMRWSGSWAARTRLRRTRVIFLAS